MNTKFFLTTVILFVLTVGFGFTIYKKNKKVEPSQSNHQNFVESLKEARSVIKKNDLYLALESQNISRVKGLLKESGDEKNFKDLLAARSIFKSFNEEFRDELFYFLSGSIKSLKAKSKIFTLRVLPVLVELKPLGEKHEQLASWLEDDEFVLEEKSVLLQGMQSWEKLPKKAIDFMLLVGKDNRNPQSLNVALYNYSLVKNKQQLKYLFAQLDQQKNEWSVINIVTFLKNSINNKKILEIEKDYFKPYLDFKKEEDPIWNEFRLLYYESYNEERKYKKEILKIALGKNNIWIKKHAQNILERIK